MYFFNLISDSEMSHTYCDIKDVCAQKTLKAKTPKYTIH